MANKSSLNSESINTILKSKDFREKMESIKENTSDNLFMDFSFSNEEIRELRQAIDDNKIENHTD
jgi:hypothetical protein